MDIIETTNLTKTYGDFTAVDNLNLRVGEGEVFGFLGPNGAGKTTTILMLLGLTEPTSGIAKVCGFNPLKDPLKVKRIVGYLPEKIGFYEDLTAKENLNYTARLNGIPRDQIDAKIVDALHDVGLSDRINMRVGKFSHGMKQRLGIADAMIKNPKVVFFDEPTSGIDPQGVEEILLLITEMAKRKITAVISTHQLQQIQSICTKVGIMSKGKLVKEGPISMLGKEAIGGGKFQILVEVSPINKKLTDAIEKIRGVIKIDTTPNTLLITSSEDIRQKIAKVVVDSGSILSGLKIEEYSLHDIYLKYFEES
jgi:ABC-2 type transport system ATP-binding protein